MSDALRQIIIGVGSLILAPINALPQPRLCITIPPINARSAIGRDFSSVSRELCGSIRQVEHAEQLELNV